jgi:hypothetical protein
MKRNRDLEATEELNSMYAYAYELKEAIFHVYETFTVSVSAACATHATPEPGYLTKWSKNG